MKREVSHLKTCAKCKISMEREGNFRVRSTGYSEPYCVSCARKLSCERSKKYWHAHPEVRAKRKLINRDVHLKHRYGISQKDYDELFSKQGGLCDICGRAPEENKPLNIDHCHVTGAVRGLLCRACNNAIGMMSENISTLAKAIKYLEAWHLTHKRLKHG